MSEQLKYSIGDMSRICNISKKALRYYDNIGLINTKRQDYNNYRYYTRDALLAVPVIKFYKQMGFTLDEMRMFIEGGCHNVYSTMQKSFLHKLTELEKEQEEVRRKQVSVKDWYDLVREAETVIENNILEVSVKYTEPVRMMFQDQDFNGDIRGAIINIEWTNYVEQCGNEITGPVVLNFSSAGARVAGHCPRVRIMQKTLLPCTDEKAHELGGCMMATCYHIGAHENIGNAYKRINEWCANYGYVLHEESFERYIADYWTTNNSAQFVTEVMVKVSRKNVA